MNVEHLVYVGLTILVLIYIVWMSSLSFASYVKCSEANRRANELLRSVLSSVQYDQLRQNGYLDIPSPRNPGRFYRVPQAQGLVKMIEHGRLKESLCLQPQEMVPDADHVVIHKLMIEADEETYLQTANKFTTARNGAWDD